MDGQIKKLITKKLVAELTIIAGIFILIATLFLYFYYDYRFITGFSAVIALLLVFFGNSNYSHLRETFKESFISELLEDWMKGDSYEPAIGLSQLQVYQSEFFEDRPYFHSEGLISGAVEKIPFLSSDVILSDQPIKKHTPTQQAYFSGRMYVFEFNKDFNFSLQLLQNLPILPKRNYKKSKTLGDKLNNRFECYATNVKQATKFLTSESRDALLNLDTNHDKSINISIVGSKLFLAFDQQEETFTFKFLKPLNIKKLDLLQNDVEIIYSLLDEIRHNNQLFVNF